MPIELDPEEQELRALLELLPHLHSAHVVEVGCGDGRLTRRYADWLKPDGRLIDVRPAHTIPDVVIGSGDHVTVVGVLTVEPERHERHAAANQALGDVLEHRLFVLEELREFVFLRYADSAEELRDYIAQKWRQTRLDGATCLRTAAALSDRPGARLWLREPVAMRRLKPVRSPDAAIGQNT